MGEAARLRVLRTHVAPRRAPAHGAAAAPPAAAAAPPAGLPYTRVAVVGTGTIGASWAAFFASQGLDCALYDASEEGLGRAMVTAASILEKMEAAGLIGAGAAAVSRRRLRRAASLADAVSSAELVQEQVFEDYAVKADVWRGIEAHAPRGTVIASSTTGLLISKMAAVLAHPERALVAHPFNPPHLVPLVELVPGPRTDPKVVAAAADFYRLLGKAPVVVKKEVMGHIANRLQAAIWREAISLVHRGVATVEDVDTAMHMGPGMRFALMGMHAVFDLGGGPGGYRNFFEGPIGKGSYEPIWKELDSWEKPPEAAKEAAIAGIDAWHKRRGTTRADLAAWRDERLAEIVRVKRDHPPPVA